MIRNAVLLVLLAALLLPGCRSAASPGDEILAGTADTAFFLSDLFRGVFWELPKFLLWTLPKGIFHDLPTWVYLQTQGDRAHVEERIARLSREDLRVEEEVAISEDLRRLTGLPIESAERWIEWWGSAAGVPEEEWRTDFVGDAIAALEADDYFTRSAAIEDLKAIYGTDLGYDPKSSPDDLRVSAARWRGHVDARGVPPLEPE